MKVPSFAGLQFIRDHVGICDVLAKQGESWRTCWEQDPTANWQEDIPGTQSTVVEWQAGIVQPHFLIVSNVRISLFVFGDIWPLLIDFLDTSGYSAVGPERRPKRKDFQAGEAEKAVWKVERIE